MNYQLAKQLKDAGFPQPPYNGRMISDSYHNSYRQAWFECYIPTLSELIEECGERFDSVGNIRGLWYAKAKDFSHIDLNGAVTPEEAVANLWLELRK